MKMQKIILDVQELEEPLLEFGNSGEHQDVKVGLREYGPLSLRFGSEVHPDSVRVGLIGPDRMLENAKRWLERCQSFIPAKASTANSLLHQEFPGFSPIFRTSLQISQNNWVREISEEKLEKVLSGKASERFYAVLQLYTDQLRELTYYNKKPDVILVCLSQEIIKRCGNLRTAPLNSQEQKIVKQQELGQMVLPGMDEWVNIEDHLLYQDFRRALKARAMDIGIPIQIGTDNLFLDSSSNEDAATRAWNVSLALFYKAGGLPWRLKSNAPETCYIGISFHHLRTQQRHSIFSSLAQAFSTNGEGFALRGEPVEFDERTDKDPHLSEIQAKKLATKVLEYYYNRVGSSPVRVIIYKTTKFDPVEEKGFWQALTAIPVVEMVSLQPSKFRLVTQTTYPPRRGTVVNINDNKLYLFTGGFYRDWKTYMGAHIPMPYQVEMSSGATSLQICRDILGLTKLNWNSARTFGANPITLQFAREVGSIMTHYAELKGVKDEPQPLYKYYM